MRLFAWSGVMILVTGLVVAVTGWLLSDGSTGWQRTMRGASMMASRRFADVWDRGDERSQLTQELATTLDMGVATFDATGSLLEQVGQVRGKPAHSFEVTRGGVQLGRVELFFRRGRDPTRVVLPLGVAMLCLWGLSGLLARRLARPLSDLAATAEAIGRGELDRRTRVARHAPREVARVAEAMDDMAARIQRQMADSRELLAAVSHEVRSPLARIRLLVELARTRGEVTSSPPEATSPPPDGADDDGAGQEAAGEVTSSPRDGGGEVTSSLLDGQRNSPPRPALGATGEDPLGAIEREVEEIDALVGSLLAGSRLDFGTRDVREVDPRDAARDALVRAGLSVGILQAVPSPPMVLVDPTLLARALANLLDNAKLHAGGPVRLAVEEDESRSEVRFSVEDDGPGLGADADRVFQAFHRRAGTRGALGLGLSIVARIAEAHGGSAFAEDRPEGGARVGFSLPTAPAGNGGSGVLPELRA